MPRKEERTGPNLTAQEWKELERLTRKLSWSQAMMDMDEDSYDLVNTLSIYASRMAY